MTLLATVAVCLGVREYRRSRSAERLLAQAYTDSRPFSFRLPDRGYSPLRRERGANSPRPASLLSAELALRKLPVEDGAANLLRARLALIQGEPNLALEQLRFIGASDDPGYLSTRAAAYYLRAEQLGTDADSLDYARALDDLMRVAQTSRNDSAVEFNLGLAFERLGLWPAARASIQRFLQANGDSGYAREARERLALIDSRSAARDAMLGKVGHDPAAFAATASDPPRELLESYWDAAFREWLPHANSPAVWKAIARLGDWFVRETNDRTLWKLAEEHPSLEGFAPLAKSIELSRSGDPKTAVELAAQAKRIFVGSPSAILVARAQELYATRRTFGVDCALNGDELAATLDSARFLLLAAQARVDVANCHAFRNRFRPAVDAVEAAVRGVRNARFDEAGARFVGDLGSTRKLRGDFAELWNPTVEVLRETLDRPYRIGRMQVLWSNLADAARVEGLMHAEYAFALGGVEAIAKSAEQSVLYNMSSRAAISAQSAGYGDEARALLARAEAALRDSPSGSTRTQFEIGTRAALAVADPGAQDPASIQHMLDTGRTLGTGLVAATESSLYEALGGAYEKRDRFGESAEAYRSAIAVYERRLASVLGAPEKLYAERSRSDAFAHLAENQLRSGDEKGAFETWEKLRSIAYGYVLDTKEVENRLATMAQTEFVVYADLPDGLWAWTADERGVHATKLRVSAREVQSEAEVLQALCSNPESSEREIWDRVARLRREIVDPIKPRLIGRKVALELDASLASLPTALFEEFRTASISGGLYEWSRRGNVTGLPARLAVLSNPRVRGAAARKFPSLAKASEEGAWLEAAFPGTVIERGSAATRAALSRLASTATALHFAGHGFSTSGDGGLVLAADARSSEDYDLFTAADVAAAKWDRCSLVVLSACSTGEGEAHGPSNPRSLTRAFLLGGAGAVVASMWNVDEDATGDLMRGFYSALGDNDAASSLELARRDLRDKRKRHPYYWAAFQVFGRG